MTFKMNRNSMIAAALAFILLEVLLVMYVDRAVSECLRSFDAERNDIVNIFRAYTDLAKAKWWLVACGLGMIVCAVMVRLPNLRTSLHNSAAKLGRDLTYIIMMVGLTGLAADIIKPIIGRARPVILQREGFYGFDPFSFTDAAWKSMPSGHVVTSVALAYALVSFFPRARVPAVLFVFLIALSRVMVNAHYIADVLAGVGVGLIAAIYVDRLINHNRINHIISSIFPIDRKKPSR